MKEFWKSVGKAVAFVVVFVAIQSWISMIAVFFSLAALARQEGIMLFSTPDYFLNLYMPAITRQLTAIILVSNILTVLGFWAFYALRKKNFAREIGLQKTSWKNLLLSAAFGFGMCFTVGVVTDLIPVPQDIMEEFMEAHEAVMGGGASLFITVISTALIGPVSEEVCFRGLVYTRLRKGMHPLFAGLLSAVFFGLVHGNPVWFLVGFLAGAGMAWVFEITGSLWCSIVVHVMNNGLVQVMEYVPMTELGNSVLVAVSAAVLVVSGIALYKLNPRKKLPAPIDPAQ